MAWIRTTVAAGCLTLGLILSQNLGGQERVGADTTRRDPGVSAAAHVRDVYGRDSQVRNALARSIPVQQPNPDHT